MTGSDIRVDTRRFSIRKPLVFVGVIALLLTAARLSILAYRFSFRSFDTFSAVWLTHDMLIAHMNETDGKWPVDWNDLDSHFALINSQGYGVPNITWVRDQIDINFIFDPSTLDLSTAAQHNAVWAMRMADGTDNGEIRSANERIRSFVINRRSPSSPP